MARVYVGNLDPRVTAREIEDEFRVFGVLRSVWVARKPPGFAFIDFDDRRDAQDAIREIDGKNGWRVELSTKSGSGRGRERSSGSDMKCYECGEAGHFARATAHGTVLQRGAATAGHLRLLAHEATAGHLRLLLLVNEATAGHRQLHLLVHEAIADLQHSRPTVRSPLTLITRTFCAIYCLQVMFFVGLARMLFMFAAET
ncbi:hypothetical protein ABZP36_024060 [Zizania latifolia]